MRYSFHPEAEAEFHEAIDYYERCQESLGHDFAVEVYSTICSIIDYPLAWPVLTGTVRRCLTSRFPYGIIYSVEGAEILILAVMHLHRAPGYWKRRAKRSKASPARRRRYPHSRR